MKVRAIEINWHPGLPIFARESFLKAVGDEYGWLGGFDDAEQLRCILPYTIIRKLFLKMVRFRVETIPVGQGLDLSEEKAFLNGCVDFFRSLRADVIIPATTNCIFRTYPDKAIAAPYGTYIINLQLPEETLWSNISRTFRKHISKALDLGVTINKEEDQLPAVHALIRTTFKRSRLPFMNYQAFERYIKGLGENCLILKAEYQNAVQSYSVFAFSDYCVYAVYTGNVPDLAPGANKLLYWEAIKYFKSLGVKKYDFVGTRINPKKGSKQEGLSFFKKQFGCQLVQGYLWKFPLNPAKYYLYHLASRIRTGGDIVDVEKHKMSEIEGGKLNE